jgi:hypothetical protein
MVGAWPAPVISIRASPATGKDDQLRRCRHGERRAGTAQREDRRRRQHRQGDHGPEPLLRGAPAQQRHARHRIRIGGKRVISFGGDSLGESVFGAALQPDGKIVLAGGSDLRAAVARLNPNGSLDTTFSGDGKKTFNWRRATSAAPRPFSSCRTASLWSLASRGPRAGTSRPRA